MLHKDRLIDPGIDLYIQFVLAADSFVSQSAAAAAGAAQQNYKLFISRVNLIIYIMHFTSTILKSHIKLVHFENIRTHYSCDNV